MCLPKNPEPGLQTLTFFSWWTEMNTRRYVEVSFNMASALFQIVLDKEMHHLDREARFNPLTESALEVVGKDTKVMSMHLHEKLSGAQHMDSRRRDHLDQWDLHVGVQINILGKPTTLMQCSLATGNWLEYQAERLVRIKKAIEEQLAKYEVVKLPAAFVTKEGPPLSRRVKKRGSDDLRVMRSMVEDLQQRLAQYRPGVAAIFGQLLEEE